LRNLRRVVVDAGHGGKDSGAISPFGTQEKELVLDVARAVRDELVRRGVEVRMTRDSDVFVPLPDRAKIANDWDADLFVSIHANASQARSLRGFEIYTLSEETDDTLLARNRAKPADTLDVILWDMRGRENRRQAKRVAEQVSGRVDDYAAVEARRLKSANFQVLKNTECPAILVEIGYLTNRRDHARLSSARYRRSMVDGIVGGIWTFKREYEATDGFARAA
jgi:N-acetylmuramoyl-L-alanine amidase